MLPEPPIGATFTPRRTFGALRGILFAILFGSVMAAVVLLIPIACGGLRSLLLDTSAPGWRAQPWEKGIPWATAALFLGWNCAIASFLHFAPAQRTGLLHSLRVAVVSTLLAVLANSLIFPRGIQTADDPDLRTRIIAFVGISTTIALTMRISRD